MSGLVLHTYFRSSAAYRVRIAFNLKGVAYESVPVHLLRDGGQQLTPDYRAINPQAIVPTLTDEAGPLTQSLAIVEYLDERYPEPPLLPTEPRARAQVRAMALAVACDIHPLNNTSPLRYLKRVLHQEQTAIDAWYHHWVTEGFEALEALVAPSPYCCGSAVTIADILLVPQVYNTRRLKVPLDAFPKITAIEAACLALPAFDKARPENQPDAE